jgi:hypothetical protein
MEKKSPATSVRFRLLGLAPLVIFLVHLHHNWSQGNPGHALWMCHVSNLALALGLLFAKPALIRAAVIWLIPGIPLWIMDMARTGQTPVITFFSHLVCPAVGLAALWRIRANRWTWLHALGAYLLCQQLARMVTPPDLNVNVAHSIYPGWERFFGAYWQYWIFTTLCAAGGLWLLGRLLLKAMPPVQAQAKRPSSTA